MQMTNNQQQKKINPLALTKAIEDAHRLMSEYCEAAELDARQRKIRFDALVAQGFTIDQAMDLVKSI